MAKHMEGHHRETRREMADRAAQAKRAAKHGIGASASASTPTPPYWVQYGGKHFINNGKLDTIK